MDGVLSTRRTGITPRSVHSICRRRGAPTINGGNYRARGFGAASGSASLVSGLTVEFGAAWNHSALVKQPTFYWADGTPINFACYRTPPKSPTNPAGLLGSPLAGAPPFQGNIVAI